MHVAVRSLGEQLAMERGRREDQHQECWRDGQSQMPPRGGWACPRQRDDLPWALEGREVQDKHLLWIWGRCVIEGDHSHSAGISKLTWGSSFNKWTLSEIEWLRQRDRSFLGKPDTEIMPSLLQGRFKVEHCIWKNSFLWGTESTS